MHQLTALSGPMSVRDVRHLDRSSAATMTNRLRTEGTDHLLAAGRAVGARRFVAQSFGAFRFARTGGPVKTEADPLDPDPPAALRTALAAIRHLERGGDGDRLGRGSRAALRRLLRSGHLDQRRPRSRRQRRRSASAGSRSSATAAASGRSSTSSDAAAATAVAVEHGAAAASTTSSTTSPRRCASGCRCWRSALGAKPPRRVPRWLGRLAGRRGGDRHDDRGAGSLEREGQARARLAAAVRELAAGLRAGARLSDDRRGASTSCGRRRSRSPTGCSAA